MSLWLARLGGGVLVLCAFLIAAEVIARNLSIAIKLNSFELSIYGFAAALAFSFAHVLIARAHIRIDILYSRWPLPLRVFVDVVAMMGMLAMAVVMAWYAWQVVATSARLGAVSNTTLQLPLVFPQGLWAMGLSWFAFVALVLLLRSLILLARGETAALQQSIGMPSSDPKSNS